MRIRGSFAVFIVISIGNLFLNPFVGCGYAEDLDGLRVNSSAREDSAVSIPLPNEAGIRDDQPEYVLGELLIKFKPGILESIPGDKEDVLVKSESIKKLNTKFGLIVIERAGSKELDMPFFRDCYRFIFPKNTDILALASQYAKDPGVAYAEPNYIVSVESSVVGETGE